MSKVAARTVSHGTFTIERELPYPPAPFPSRLQTQTT